MKEQHASQLHNLEDQNHEASGVLSKCCAVQSHTGVPSRSWLCAAYIICIGSGTGKVQGEARASREIAAVTFPAATYFLDWIWEPFAPAVVVELLDAALHVIQAQCLVLGAGIRWKAAFALAEAHCAARGVEAHANLPITQDSPEDCLGLSSHSQRSASVEDCATVSTLSKTGRVQTPQWYMHFIMSYMQNSICLR